jgi:predicted CoA-substrate-specific enzyme activase
VSIVVGVDVGSTNTKLVLMADSQILAAEVQPTGANCRNTANALLDAALKSCGRERSEIGHVVSTGYGRRMVDFAHGSISEILANARGAIWLHKGTAPVRTVIDVGGQDSKVISLDDSGRVINFAMNDKCAAGTGRFLEVAARILEIDLDTLAELSLKSKKSVQISSVCAVFAETEIVSLISRGERVEDIAAGLHESIARRVSGLVATVGLRETVFFDGGPAFNHGLARAFEEELSVSLVVPDSPQIVTAIGAALTARDALSKERKTTPEQPGKA